LFCDWIGSFFSKRQYSSYSTKGSGSLVNHDEPSPQLFTMGQVASLTAMIPPIHRHYAPYNVNFSHISPKPTFSQRSAIATENISPLVADNIPARMLRDVATTHLAKIIARHVPVALIHSTYKAVNSNIQSYHTNIR